MNVEEMDGDLRLFNAQRWPVALEATAYYLHTGEWLIEVTHDNLGVFATLDLDEFEAFHRELDMADEGGFSVLVREYQDDYNETVTAGAGEWLLGHLIRSAQARKVAA